MKRIIGLALGLCCLAAQASETPQPPNQGLNNPSGEGPTPPKEGLLAMSQSQQPGPMISFGQNILDKHEAQYFIFASDYSAINTHYDTVIPSLIYGISDVLSLFLSAPYDTSNKLGNNQSQGLGDASAQLEYAFYSGTSIDHTTQATIVGNLSLPSGSGTKNPNTGYGAPSVFLGTTWNRTYVDWYYFVSPGATFTVAKNGTKFGNSYLYQAGLARQIKNTENWLFAWMVEGDGTYSQKNRVSGYLNPNTGGNVFYVTPSIWASTKHFVLQAGLGWAVAQHLFGNQPRNTYLAAVNVGWAVY